jgi:hypothetical protein
MAITNKRILYYFAMFSIITLTLFSVFPYARVSTENPTDTCTLDNTSSICSLQSPQLIKSEKRSPWEALYLQTGIRLKWAYLQWFGLKPFIYGVNSTPSPYRPPNCPK